MWVRLAVGVRADQTVAKTLTVDCRLVVPNGQAIRRIFAEHEDRSRSRICQVGSSPASGLKVSDGVIGRAMTTGEQVRIDDAHAEGCCAGEGMQSELVIPLLSKGSPVGVLDLRGRDTNRFTDEHQKWLAYCAAPLANAVENRRLYESLSAQTKSLSLLHELSQELTAILDTDRLLTRVAESVHRLIPYDFFSVFRWNESRQLLESIYARRGNEVRTMQTEGLPLGYGLCGTAAALRRPVRVPNVDVDPRFVNCENGVRVRSEMVVPLLAEGRLVGVMGLESSEYDSYSEQHERVLSTLGSSVGIALENARLYEVVRSEERRLEDELETARLVQRGLLPVAGATPGLEVAQAFVPANELGGDFYDVLAYGGERTAFAIGDVSGKGTAAALLGSAAVGMLRGHAIERTSGPAEMLTLMNRHIQQSRISDRFLAMAFGIYDGASRRLTVASAGFPLPWLMRAGRVVWMPVEGIALGLLPAPGYIEQSLVLNPGDTVVLASDGFEEAMSPDGEPFGFDRMRAVLNDVSGSKPDFIVDELLRATDEHAASEPTHDDRTVIVLRVLQGGGSLEATVLVATADS